MKRQFIVVFCSIFLMLACLSVQAKAADELTGLTLEKEVRAMMELGIIKGYGDGKVYPKAIVTRQDFAAFLARTMKLAPAVPEFTDVSKSSALAGEIGAIQKTGIMRGTLTGEFFPAKQLTREEMAITMNRALSYLQLQPNLSNIIISDERAFGSAEGIASARIVFSANLMNGTSISSDGREIVFSPANYSQRDQVAAVLKRFIDYTQSPAPQPPQPPTSPTPPPADPTKFELAEVSAGTLKRTGKLFTTYNDAVQAMSSNPSAVGIYKGTELLRVKSGVAFSQGPRGINTIIYSSPDFKSQLTYIEAGREMRILGYAEHYVQVQVADTVGYVKHEQIDFVPAALIEGRDYYTRNANNELIHFTYNYLTKSTASYNIGPAPDFMKLNVKYYSADGVHYLDGAGKPVGTHYPYFQFQSIRTTTSYTAAELDAFIMKTLEDRSKLSARYANATTASKLIGLGSYLKQMEREHRVNALFILSTAIHESDYGMSANAQTKNNLFGIRVFDSTPEAGEKYATPQRSVEAFVLEYANKNYGPPSGGYAKGAAPGNKTAGFNVHYASDPTWGAKIAGHMWRADQQLGGRDYQSYRLAMTNQSGKVNVRKEPVVRTDTFLFEYKPRDMGRSKETGYPVAIVEQRKGGDGYLWYKVLSDAMLKDSNGNLIEYGWIRGDLVFDLAK